MQLLVVGFSDPDFHGQIRRALGSVMEKGIVRPSSSTSPVSWESSAPPAIIAAVIFLSVSLVAGYLLGGPGGGTRRVLAVGTAQRNLSAALAVATLNFTDPDVMVIILVVGLAGLVLLIFAGGELGKRAKTGDVFLERTAVTLRLWILVCTGPPADAPFTPS
ncbi:hypothetical protein [Methanoculleus caldifontis]|uniref:hypothetical protein n=1 Tax=Methanoculleus caldifontis TaxID=2651577 RepID=UPI00293723AC|nr:hypothetical protein [Methanoculleus sp. Wushi-C6]